MLKWCRPHESQTEKHFVTKYILKPYKHFKPKLLGPMHNIVIQVGEGSRTLFSCHTDTVHRKGGKQNIKFDPEIGLIYKDTGVQKQQRQVKGGKTTYSYSSYGDCLGADDTTGIWIMLEMIDAKIPGTYVFHRGEERGGVGSGWMADHKEDWLRDNFDRAIAFDRKEETSVITSQSCGDCCSNSFAKDLCARLGTDWKPDPTGTFTDTANYAFLIPECTNISVGYNFQHTSNEYQDLFFAENLLDIINTMDWESLVTERDPKQAEIERIEKLTQQKTFFHSEYDSVTKYSATRSEIKDVLAQDVNFIDESYLDFTCEDILNLNYEDLVSLCEKDPDWAAGLIYESADRDYHEVLSETDMFAH